MVGLDATLPFWEGGLGLGVIDRLEPEFYQPPLLDDAFFMREALRQANKAMKAEEVPIGAVIVHNGSVIARAWNQVEMLKDATAHAEMLALTQAQSHMEDWRLNECDLYVTKEPCPMCAGAIMHCRVRRVIFGCRDAKGGAAGGYWNLLQAPNLNHHSEVTAGVMEEECVEILKSFFKEARAKKAQAKGLLGGEKDILGEDCEGSVNS